jgi:hypothetical protein
MKNYLLKENYWNSYFAITNKGQAFELDNIIIYNEKGNLIETNSGWFNESNNTTGEKQLTSDILKINTGNEEKHKKEKHNFIVKTQSSYKDGYTLYIYYKNIDYKFIGIEKDSLFLNIKYQLFNDDTKTYEKAIGHTKKFSQEIYYKLTAEIKQTEYDTFKYDRNIDALNEHLKNINKLKNKMLKMQEEEKNYSFEKLIGDTGTYEKENQEEYKNNLETFGGNYEI